MLAVDFSILNQKATPAIYADTLANRPAANFAGRLFVATDSPYGVFRDTGAAWVQVASNGGGGSTGINGLNGTSNIGLGGTLANNTIIAQNAKNITFSKTGTETFNVNSFFIFDYTDALTYRHLIQPNGLGALNLFVGNTTLSKNGLLQIHEDRIKTIFNGTGQYGLLLNDNIGKFSLGDYNNNRKYNSFVVDDDNDRFYITTSYNQINNAQDLFYVSNKPGVPERFVKLGDFNNYVNGTSFTIDDENNTIISTIGNLMNGIWVTPSFTVLGQTNISQYLYLSIDYGNNTISTFDTAAVNDGFKLDFTNNIYQFGSFNSAGNYIEINDTNNSIELLTTNLNFTGAALQSNTAGGNSGEHLVINLNGTQYKIKLENP
jgi:hypothetical protein